MNAGDIEKLQSYRAVINSALRDIDDFYSDGCMSDVKSAVFALPRKLQELGLSDAALEAELVALAEGCWTAMYNSADGGTSAEARAGRAAGAIGVLERRLLACLGEPA